VLLVGTDVETRTTRFGHFPGWAELGALRSKRAEVSEHDHVTTAPAEFFADEARGQLNYTSIEQTAAPQPLSWRITARRRPRRGASLNAG